MAFKSNDTKWPRFSKAVKSQDTLTSELPKVAKTKEEVIKVCWDILNKIFNANYEGNRKVRHFVAEYRASLFNQIPRLDIEDKLLKWLSYMARLETIGLKDPHLIECGELAYRAANSHLSD